MGAHLTLWRIDPADNSGTAVEAFERDKPIVVYLGGSGDFTCNESKLNLNRAVRSFLSGISRTAYELYIPTLNVVNRGPYKNRGELNNMPAHASELADALLPEIPVSLPELKLAFSRFTLIGFSHGCEEAQALLHEFRQRLRKTGRFNPGEIDEALQCLAIVNIGKARKHNLPEYDPTPTYTVVSGADSIAFPQSTMRSAEEHESTRGWKWQSHADITHALEGNHLVVCDYTAETTLKALRLEFPQAQDSHGTEREEPAPTWRNLERYVGDGHHMYLYTNTDSRFLRDKATQVFQSMATAPLTMLVMHRFVQGSMDATLETPRDASNFLHQIAQNELLPQGKEALMYHFAQSKKNYSLTR